MLRVDLEDLPGQVSVYFCLAPASHLLTQFQGMSGKRPNGDVVVVWKMASAWGS